MLEPKLRYNKRLFRNKTVPDNLKMDFEGIIEKPIYVGTYTWASTDTGGELYRLGLPGAALKNYLMQVPFKSAALANYEMCAMLQVSGTSMHMGSLIAVAIPNRAPRIASATQALMAPHTFLFANESTPTCLELPFYVPAYYDRTYVTGEPQTTTLATPNVVDLVLFVNNQLSMSTGASSSLSVSVHIIFKHADFRVPKNEDMTWSAQGGFSTIVTSALDDLTYGTKRVTGDLIDSIRAGIKSYTGFHNPNVSLIDKRVIYTDRNITSNVDNETRIEKLDPYSTFDRICDDFYFRTDIDEMSVKHLLSKPHREGVIKINNTDTKGTLLFAHPITPLMEMSSSPNDWYGNMRSMYETSRYWRGSINMHLQSIMTNFHYFKITVVLDYSTDAQGISKSPNFADTHNLITHSFEFSAGGQVQTLNLPYCSPLPQIECTPDYWANVCSHGMVYIYLQQPLVFNSSVPTSAYVNVYFSGGEDLAFMGYGIGGVNHGTVETPPTYTAQSAIAMIPSDQSKLLEVEDNVIYDKQDSNFKVIENIRDIVRRYSPMPTQTITAANLQVSKGIVIVPVAELLHGVRPVDVISNPVQFWSMKYHGFRGGLKVKLAFSDAASVRVKYMPPATYQATTPIAEANVQGACNYLISASSAVGINTVNTHTTNATITDPSAPVIEMYNAIIPTGKGYGGVVEFVIPYMNVANYTGRYCEKYYARSTDLKTSANLDLGTIILSFQPNLLTTTKWDNDLFYKIYIGVDDTARFGIQTTAPYSTVFTVNSDSVSPVVPVRGSAYIIGKSISSATQTLDGIPTTYSYTVDSTAIDISKNYYVKVT